MEGCIFAKSWRGYPVQTRVRDEHCLAFHDLHPQAPYTC